LLLITTTQRSVSATGVTGKPCVVTGNLGFHSLPFGPANTDDHSDGEEDDY